MTDQQINIAIAEACGYEHKRVTVDDEWCADDGELIDIWRGPNTGWVRTENLPDYCHDLNAMHEVIDNVAMLEFLDQLCFVVTGKSVGSFKGQILWYYKQSDVVVKMFKSTAHQRAEAFLRTIGKWKE